MYLGLRVLTGAAVASAVTFLIAGSHAYLLETRVMFFAWGLFLGMIGATGFACLFFDTLVRSESDRNARATADAVGEAVNEVLADDSDDDSDVTHLSSTRRGT